MLYIESKWQRVANIDRFGTPGTKVCSWFDQWNEAGVHGNKNGIEITITHDIYGKAPKHKPWRSDGWAAMQAMSKDTTQQPYGDNWPLQPCLDHSGGVTYGFAATFFGVGIQVETDRTTATEQCAEADTSNGMPNITGYDNWSKATDSTHFFWGNTRHISATLDRPPRNPASCTITDQWLLTGR
jgi:hypothetical protein